jgi:hypothetical protein
MISTRIGPHVPLREPLGTPYRDIHPEGSILAEVARGVVSTCDRKGVGSRF